MKKIFYRELVTIANSLDSLGQTKLADRLDVLVKEAIDLLPEPIGAWDVEHHDPGKEESYGPGKWERSTPPMTNTTSKNLFLRDPETLTKAPNRFPYPREAFTLLVKNKHTPPPTSSTAMNNWRIELDSAASVMQDVANKAAISAARWNQDMADEIAMHIMEKVLAADNVPDNVEAWAKTVAKNYMIDQKDKRKREVILPPESFSNRMQSGLPNPEEMAMGRRDDEEVENFKRLKQKVLSELDTSRSRGRADTIRQMEDWAYRGSEHPFVGMEQNKDKNKLEKQISRAREALDIKINDMRADGEITEQEKEALLQWASTFRIRSAPEE